MKRYDKISLSTIEYQKISKDTVRHDRMIKVIKVQNAMKSQLATSYNMIFKMMHPGRLEQ